MAEPRVQIDITLDEEGSEYFRSCARMRGISMRSLTRRLLRHILQDKLIGPILDDQDDFRRLKGEHSYKGPPA